VVNIFANRGNLLCWCLSYLRSLPRQSKHRDSKEAPLVDVLELIAIICRSVELDRVQAALVTNVVEQVWSSAILRSTRSFKVTSLINDITTLLGPNLRGEA
jgi:hypothetical protein